VGYSSTLCTIDYRSVQSPRAGPATPAAFGGGQKDKKKEKTKRRENGKNSADGNHPAAGMIVPAAFQLSWPADGQCKQRIQQTVNAKQPTFLTDDAGWKFAV
jgi:hypothetical protein